ncbi:KpsF/GutQ family sugar-phosphate isomerase [Chthonobacter rhizosphaerae]|uniref:KpsF/GutQ family sugar-phosphate isomerase n=1 Tax=Chthonobacter rhizosphaerae TaxID=2735553 RepID=UPI0015EEE69B|nr:KpsF/GutQ family sugar-phosphate isomerase [Chthonobacter rhizosphaerae]
MPMKTTASALRTLDIATKAIDAVRSEIGDGKLGERLAAAARLIRDASGRLIVVGVGKSGHIGRKLAATFASTGTPAYFVHAGEASHGDLGMIDREDVVLALSWSGETTELADILTYAKRFNVPLIALTSGAQSTLARNADVALVLPKVQEACPNGLAPTTSTLLQLAIGDALAIALLEEKGFSAIDFRVFHPGGKLGAQLTFVRDLMHEGDRMPLLSTGAPMTDALMEMTSRGFGVVGITDPAGDLVGVITDGDLRRHMSMEILSLPVDEVMSRAPKTIAPDVIAGEALESMQAQQISVLFVVENGKPVGIIHVLDMLRAGVA